MAGIKDVAKLAGVGIATVSRVLNGSKNVSDELRIKVEHAVEELGYSANPLAKGLKSTKTNNIAVVITSINRIFFTDIVEGISKICKENGYSVHICETHDDVEEEINLVQSLVAQWVDGIILVSSVTDINDKTQNYINSLSSLHKKGVKIPVINLEFPCLNDQVDSVVVNHREAAYKAVTHLIELNRRDIVHITIPLSSPLGVQRLNGYKQALSDNNIEIKEDLIVSGDYSVISGYTLTKNLISENKKFNAIFAANDQMAVGAIKACKDYNLKIPQDVAIIGYDDVFVTSLVEPSLSSMRIERFEMGSTAAERLIYLISNDNNKLDAEIITLDTKLIVRESTVKSAKRNLKKVFW